MSGTHSIKSSSALKFSISMAILLAVLKIVTALVTNSMAILASALDSIMDAGISSVNLVAVREASKPPDEEHTYGHGKIESLASLFQSTFIGISGAYLVFESIRRCFVGSELKEIPVGIGVMIVSAIFSVLIVWRMQKTLKGQTSLVISAEKLHYSMDIITNVGVIAALILVEFTPYVFWDLLVSTLVSFYIFKSSYTILRRSIDELLDRSLSPISKQEIEEMILSHHPSIVGLHEFRSHCVGDKIFLDFHIEIRGENDFRKAHNITENLIQEIRQNYPGADVTVHYDPEGEC